MTYSELDAYRQCPLKHKWSYKDRWVKPPKVGSPLSRGSLWHLVLECHYTWVQRFGNNVAVDPAFLFEWVKKHLLYDEAGRQNEDQEKVEWLYDGHLDCYGLDPDWEVLEVEFAGQVPLPGPEGGLRVDLRFKVDLVVRDRATGKVWLVDHKSARDFSRETEVDLDDQFGLYTWALRQLGYPVFGTVRSDARTQRNKSPMTLEQRFRRVSTYRTEQELDNLVRDAYNTACAAWGGDTPLHSSPAPDRCSWRCDFLQAHLLYRKGVASEETVLQDFGFTVNDKKHREYDEDPVVSLVPPAGTRKPHLWTP
ncbi:RecB-like nuclease [Gordonia phage Ghobes]|uniref:RecB-like nuclease n=1 Tax=Gordonia phage Ghobes TaxID=1887647 RepID=A0A1B3B058_9CAUD|nr:exonuclease [Gordonia phage Ghobes]AOE44384.1 RecB-like nuclease [Gordonia phage Ghobes]